MKINKLYKRIIAFICSLTLIVASMTGIGSLSVKAADDIFVDGAVIDYGEVTEYAYNYGWLCGATSEYKYMIITYTGDISNLRLQFTKGDNSDANYYWFDQAQATHLTLVGDPVLSSEEGATVVVDIEASGINLDNFDAMHMHYGPGTLNIGYVRLSTSPEVTDVDVMPIDDIYVDGAVIDYGEVTDYAYNYGWLCGATSEYKYMIITYTGDISNLRLQFTKGDDRDANYYWFEQTQDTHLTLVGDAVLSSEEGATVVVDIEASGINLDNFDAMDMHYGPGTLNIGYVRLSTSPEVTWEDEMPGDEPEELYPINLSAFEGVWAPAEDTPDGEYAYLAGMDVNAAAGYKYLELTYKGDATAFKDFRIQIGDKTYGLGEIAYDGAAVTVDGSAVPAPTEEEQTVVIDLEATGVDITQPIAVMHMHQTAGNGSFEITDAWLLSEYSAPVDPSTLEDIILNGDENGASSMIKSWTVAKPAAGDQYKYLGFATLKEPTSDYRYLILTYAGDIASVRFEFAKVDEKGNETAKVGPWWFNKEGQELYFVTADESDIPLDGGKGTTIVIDLWASGIDLDEYNSVHMHAGYGAESKDISFQIGMARLSTSADITATDVMPAEQTTTKPVATTQEPTTQPQTTTTPAATEKVTAPAKAKIKKITAKKKSAKKLSLKIKKVTGAAGYQVAVYKTKKNAKNNKKAVIKKIVTKRKVTLKSKKLKNQKKLFVRVRAYVLDSNGKKVYGKWSARKKVTIK